MKKGLLLVLLLFGFGVNAQKSTEDETIYTTTEKNPIYVGGMKALYSFLCENINAPLKFQ